MIMRKQYIKMWLIIISTEGRHRNYNSSLNRQYIMEVMAKIGVKDILLKSTIKNRRADAR